MAPFISRKLSLALLGGAWLAALAIVLLASHALSGPRLGRMYDFLLGLRPPPPASGQILLIETGQAIEPAAAISALMALAEFGAADLLIEVPVLGAGSGTAESGAELAHRIGGEFYLVGRNIRSLFDAIRLGLLAPEDAPRYVESLVELSERGRDRLAAAALRQEGEGARQAEMAAAAFGSAVAALDLSPPRAAPEGEAPWRSRGRPDRDGKLRRIAPLEPAESPAAAPSGLPTVALPAAPRGARGEAAPPAASAAAEEPAASEQIALRALRRRWAESGVEEGAAGKALAVRLEAPGGGMAEFRFPLDRGGSILFESPERPGRPGGGARGHGGGFRRIGIGAFLEHDRADRAMARLLRDAWNMGLYAEARPERIPLILFERAESLRDAMLEAPGAEARAAWLAARSDYVGSLEEFLYGPSEMIMVNGYELEIALMLEEGACDAKIGAARERRDDVMRAFVAMREARRELERQRGSLSLALEGAFCIMAPPSPWGDGAPPSALLANALLTGRSINPGQRRSSVVWPLAAALAALALIQALGARMALPLGIAASLLCLAAFGAAFVATGYWIDPAIPAAAVLGGALFLSASRLRIAHAGLLRFREEALEKERVARLFFGEAAAPGAHQRGLLRRGAEAAKAGRQG